MFLKTLIMSFMLEGGVIPGHEVSLYPVDDYTHQSSIDFRQSCYVDMSTKIRCKYAYLSGGVTAWEWACKQAGNFYPFRMDFQLEVAVTIGALTIGTGHGCYHPVLPEANVAPYGKLDAGSSRVFVRVEIEKHLFN
jgi:hypothetical protein